MKTPTFHQGQAVGFYAHSWGGNIVKVIRYRNDYLYRVKVIATDGITPVFFTVPASNIYAAK